MASLEHDLRNCIFAFDSNSISERKKSMDRLRELVNDRRIIQLLNRNSLSGAADGIDWTYLLNAVHRLLIQESEKIKQEEAKGSMTAPVKNRRATWKNDCSSLAAIIVNKANQDIPKIKCSALLGCILEILDNDYYRENYGVRFIEILRSRVMPFRKYWSDMSSELWMSLLETFLRILKTPPPQAEYSAVVEVLNRIVIHGTENSQLGLKLKSKFPVIAEAFNDPRFYNTTSCHEWLLHLLFSMCLQLARESRMACCHFGENVLVPVIHLYDKMSKEKKDIVFNFLLLQMHLHHPLGATSSEGAAYAFNWDQWQHKLNSLYALIESKINKMHEIKSDFYRETSLHPVFLQFAVEVCKQVFFNNCSALDVTVMVTNEEASATPSPKRRRVLVGIQAVMDTIRTVSDPHYMWPWLSLLSALMLKYPESVKEVDFIPLLQMLVELLTACKDTLVMDHLCLCCISIMKVEKNLIANTLDEQTVDPLWEKIWEITLRTVGLNQSEKNSHHLLQELITHNKAVRPVELVHMYISGTIRLSVPSLQTLNLLLMRCDLPDKLVPWTSSDVKVVRLALLDWLLPDRTVSTCSEQTSLLSQNVDLEPSLLAKVLIQLILKSQFPDISSSAEHKSSRLCSLDSSVYEIEQDYVLSCFEGGLLVPHTNRTVPGKAVSTPRTLLNMCIRDKLIELLIRDCYFFLQCISEDGTRFPEVINEIILLLEIWSWMLKLNILPCNSRPSFAENLRNILGHVSVYIVGVIENIRHKSYLSTANILVNKLKELFMPSYHKTVSIALREMISQELLLGLFKMAKTRLTAEEDAGDDDVDLGMSFSQKTERTGVHHTNKCSTRVDDITVTNGYLTLTRRRSLSDMQKLQLDAAKVLCYFCCGSGSEDVVIVDNLLTKLLELFLSGSFDLDDFSDFNMAVEVLECILCASNLKQHHVSSLLRVLQAMCRAWYKDAEGVSIILKLLQGTLVHVHRSGEALDKENSLRLMKGMMKNLNNKKPGPKVFSSFIDCLSELAKVDPAASWSTWDCGTLSVGDAPAVEEILVYLKSPFHEVRMAVVKNVCALFLSSTNLQWQSSLFDKLHTIVMDSFVVEGELTEEDANDEGANRAASALHALAVLVVISPYLRKRALFGIFQLVKEKNLRVELVYKVLVLIGESLNLQSTEKFMGTNLNYLLTRWFQKNHKLQEFPWLLLNCKSEVDFYYHYKEEIVPILLQRDDDETLLLVCQRLGCQVNTVLEDCYPRIMARLVPCFSFGGAGDVDGVLQQDVKAAKLVYTKLESILTEGQIKALLRQHLDVLVVEVMHLVYDPTHFSKLCGSEEVMPQPDLPFFTANVAVKSLEYLQKTSPAPDIPLMVFLSKKLPACIQRMLLQLALAIHSAPTCEDRLLAFYQYSTFTYILGSELERDGLGSLAHFIIRDVVHMLLHIMESSYKNNETSLTAAVCHFLGQFSKQCLAVCAHIVAKFLTVTCSALVPLVKSEDTHLSSEALALLKFFIIDNSEKLSSAIKLLDPFPENPVFDALRVVCQQIKYDKGDFSLEDEISHFLNSENVNLGCRTEGLQHIRIQLSQRKKELKIMYNDLKSIRGFSEDCANSILHQLICTLVELASHSDPGMRQEAARCLGELGPADLTTTVLRPESKRGLPENDTPVDLLVFAGHVLRLLTNYLVDEDIKVVEAASKALYVVLASKEGQTAIETSLSKPNQEYLVPFLSTKKSKQNSSAGIDEKLFKMQVDCPELWCPEYDCSHESWITKLVCSILETFPKDNCFLPNLISMCKVKVSFSENILPLLVTLVLKNGSDNCNATVWRHIQYFFHQHFNNYRTSAAASLKKSEKICLNRASVQCMLDIVHCVWLQNKSGERYETALDLNFLHVAQAAQFCSAYFTSILYTELWCGAQLRYESYVKETFCKNTSPLEYVCDKNPEDGIVVQNILREAYMKIGDSDAVYGCGSSHLLNPRTRIHQYELVGKWEKVWNQVMLAYDVELASGNMDATRGLLGALQKCSLHHVLNGYIKSLDPKVKCNQQDYEFECTWRLAQWDTTVTTTCNKQELRTSFFGREFEKCRFESLKAIHESDTTALEEALANARSCVIESLTHASLESSKNLYKPLSHLQAIQEIEDFANIDMKSVLEKWRLQDEISFNEFEFIEHILWQRTVLLSLAEAGKGEKIQKAMEVLANLHLDIAILARNEGCHQVAARSHAAVTQIVEHVPNIAVRLKLEEACLSWERGDKEVGKYLLRSLLSSFSSAGIISDDDLKIYSTSLKLYGDWMAETKSENARIILNNYYLKAIRIMENASGGKSSHEHLLDTYFSLARFADAEYQQLVRYMKSSVYEMKKKWIGKARKDAMQLKQQPSMTKDDKRAVVLMEKQSHIDMAEIENTEKERDMYLTHALTYYLHGLIYGDKNNLQVFRVASLWLDNMFHEELNKILESNLTRVPSHKFVPLLPQLTPRMSNVEDTFVVKLNGLLERCAIDHPHHTLPLILALANSYKDRDYISAACSSQNDRTQEPRVLGAQLMVRKLLSKPAVGPLLKKMEQVSIALISLAYLQVKNTKAESHKVPESEPISKLRDLNSVLIPTLSIPVKVNCQYDNIIGIHKFQSTFTLVGGINVPKKIQCIGTDGIARPQLVKGQDDLRQDAVMQQVFTIINMFLKNNKDTSKRKLVIRTYKVVPLSQRSGIIEWCQNTQPLSAYLTGEDQKMGAHRKYYPQDLPPHKCREKFRSVATKPNDKKLEVFQEICTSLHPVFHYFFLEKFPTPGVWYERRLAYIHSVATSSMIGYILGIGDRHTLNILIDNTTAEVIHIDFGIAFEMGLILPTPETVPFRLTRDIVDGMGVCGIEGVFRRSCEKTLTVLRQNQATILTILEVLLYDPLYAWTITPNKAYNLQRSGSEEELADEEDSSVEVNKMAERALLRLQQKLQGVELETVTSVADQVDHLLHQASDPGNLSRLYFGWQPYL